MPFVAAAASDAAASDAAALDTSAVASPPTPSAKPRSAAKRSKPGALTCTSCGRFSPIMRIPASIAAMISPTSRVLVAASKRTEPSLRPAACSAAATRSSTACTLPAISPARAASIVSFARFLCSMYAVITIHLPFVRVLLRYGLTLLVLPASYRLSACRRLHAARFYRITCRVSCQVSLTEHLHMAAPVLQRQ